MNSKPSYIGMFLDLGMLHADIKLATPSLNGKIEWSHLTDQRELYQILDYDEYEDLRRKFGEWEDCYNYLSPQSAEDWKHLTKC